MHENKTVKLVFKKPDKFQYASVSSNLHSRRGTIDYDWLVPKIELVAIPRYKFLTFFSRTIHNYKQPFSLVSNNKMGLIAEFTQLRMHFKISTIEVFCRGFVPH